MPGSDVDATFELSSFHEVLNHELQKASSCRNAVTLMFIKFLHLDQVGTNYGTLTAASLLRDIKRHICESIRRDDHGLICGSDELIIILPNTPKEGANRIALKLQRLVESFTFTNGKGAQVTLTPKVGIASYSYSGKK